MKNRSGIWIDSKKAVIVHLNGNEAVVTVLHSGLETSIRIPGEGKWFARFADQYMDFGKRKENPQAHRIKNFLARL